MDEEAKRESRRQKLLQQGSSMQSLRCIEKQLENHCLAEPSASRDNSQRSLKSCLHKSNSSINSAGMRVSFSRDNSLNKFKYTTELSELDLAGGNKDQRACSQEPTVRRGSLTITDLEDKPKSGEFYVSFSSLNNKSNGNTCDLTTDGEFLESLRSLSINERNCNRKEEAASGEFYVSCSQIKKR